MLAWIAVIVLCGAIAVVVYYAALTRRIAADAERRIPMVGRTVSIDGNRIHYVDEGEGPPIVFIHGLGGQLHHFRHPLFPAMGEGSRLIAIDRPGSGYSTRPGGGERIPEQAATIAKFIDVLGLERPVVVGHSLGGAIALRLALDFPGKVSALALISPLTRYIPQPPEQFGGLYIASPLKRRFIAHTFAVPASLKHAQATLDFIFGPQAVTPNYAYGGGGYLGLRPSHFYAASSDLVAVEKDLGAQDKRYGELRMPVGIIYGDQDRVLDFRRQGQEMADKVEGLDLEILEGVGHMPQFVEPDRVAAFIRRVGDRAMESRVG